MNQIAAACAAYFKNHRAFRRIMDGILQKYSGLGRVGGQVRLSDASIEELEAARLLFGRSFTKPLIFKISDFEKALQDTPYRGVLLPELLEAYYGPIQTKPDARAEKTQILHDAVSRAMTATQSAVCRGWLQTLADKTGGGTVILRQELMTNSHTPALIHVGKAMDWLEKHKGYPIRLAVLSARATSYPHALDSNGVTGKLFLYMLAFSHESDFPKTAEQRDALYYRAGVLCDSISSSVTQTGLVLNDANGEHPAFREFRLRRESSTLTLTNLAGLTSAFSPSGRAYLVENQMVFSQLCDHAPRFHSPLICTSGQLQVAVLRLLDMLDASGTLFFYSGDFDGGGLSIAERLMNRYAGHMNLWHMTPEDYYTCTADKEWGGARFTMLNGFESNILIETAHAIRERGVAGYQELLITELLHDIVL